MGYIAVLFLGILIGSFRPQIVDAVTKLGKYVIEKIWPSKDEEENKEE